MPRNNTENSPTVIADGKYSVEKEIGKGSFATVYRGHITADSTIHIAIKAVSRSNLKNKKLLENLEIEIAILKKIKHNHIVDLIDCERTSTDFYLIMEYCALGDLTFLIKKRKELMINHPLLQKVFEQYPPPNENHNGLNQAFILNYLQQLVSALKFLRSKNLVHRDIKPQNLLLSTPLINYTDSKTFHDLGYVGIYNLPILKVADFGFARFLPNSSLAETLCGSPLYMAPEILNYQKYNAKADLWSVGTVLFEMCCGHPPFRASNHLELYKKIKRAKDQITFPSYFDKYPNNNDDLDESDEMSQDEQFFHEINSDLKDLICGLLTFDPQERLVFDEFFNNKLVNLDLSRFELTNNNSSIIESTSKNIVDSNMFISEFLAPKKKAQMTALDSPNNKNRIISNNNNNNDTNNNTNNNNNNLHQSTTIKNNNTNEINTNLQNSDIMLEKEYVVVEKKSVEVNELADEFAKLGTNETYTKNQLNKEKQHIHTLPPHNIKASKRTLSNNSNSSRRASLVERRLSINSLNPTNALSRALGVASIRLFGGNTSNQPIQQGPASSSIFNSQIFNDLTDKIILRINDEETQNPSNMMKLNESSIKDFNNSDIVHILEVLSAKAFVIYSYAEVKYSQVIPLISIQDDIHPPPPSKRLSSGSCAIEDEEDDEPNDSTKNHTEMEEIDLVLYKEIITLYLKALEILSMSMKITSMWWFKYVEKQQTNFNACSLRLNLLVQWIREKFNECLSKADFIRMKLVEQNFNDHTDGVFLEKLLYDRALEISKNAARTELTGHNLSSCELSYATSLWMLEVILDDVYNDENNANEINANENIETNSSISKLDENDKKIIKKYIDSIATRLKFLRQKLSVSVVQHANI